MESLTHLEANEARILGVLIEKELTTPDQYPLSLNATTAGCNQKSNRNPLLTLSETEVQMQLDKLVVAGFVGRVHPATSRVERFRHNIREHLGIGEPQAAILAELMMRGPQTRGDLRTRVSRMTPLDSLDVLAQHIDLLTQKGLIKRIPPARGSRAERFVQCLAPDAHPLDESEPNTAHATPASIQAQAASGKLEALEARVTKLERQLSNLAGKLGETLDELED